MIRSPDYTIDHLANYLLESNFDRLGALRFGHEADEPFTLFAKGIAVFAGQGLERFDQEGCRFPLLLDLPGAAHEAVDEERGPDPGGREESRRRVQSPT